MKCANPSPFMFFASSSSLNITLWNLLNDHDGKVIRGVLTFIEVFSHCRFLRLFVSDVILVVIEANVQGSLCQTDILFWAFSTLNQIDYTHCLAGSRCGIPCRIFW